MGKAEVVGQVTTIRFSESAAALIEKLIVAIEHSKGDNIITLSPDTKPARMKYYPPFAAD